MTPLLSLKSVTLKFGGLTALSDVTWEIPTSGIHGIIGPNGAGKSTLFNLVTGLYQPTSGAIFFEAQPLQKLKTEQRSRLGIARTFQNIRLLPQLSVLENLLVVAAVEREGTFWGSLVQTQRSRAQVAAITERAQKLLQSVGLVSVQNQLPGALPYGDQRKLEIARALMKKPKLLLLDEPAAGMNAVEKNALQLILKEICAENVTVLVIEHDMKFMMNLSQHITVFNQGSICAQGTPSQIQSNPQVIESYLGKRASSQIKA